MNSSSAKPEVHDASTPAGKSGASQPASSAAHGTFFTHAVIYGLGTLALQAASIILVPLYTRCLSPSEFGVLEMLSRVGEIFNICLMANGIQLATFSFYCPAKTEEERKRTAATVLLAPLGLLLASIVITAGIAPYLQSVTGIENSTLVFVAVSLVMCDALTVVPLALMQARIESATYVAATAGMFGFRVSLTILFVAGLGWGIWGVLGAAGLTSTLFGSFLTWRELRRSSFWPDMGKLRELLKFALPFVPIGLCGMVLHNGDRFFLMSHGGTDEVGKYALGYKLVWAMTLLSTGPLSQVWNVRVYHVFELPDAAKIVGRASTRILAAFIFAGMGLCIFDVNLLEILAPATYSSASVVVAPITMAYFFWIAANLCDATLWAKRRSGLKSGIIFISTSAMVALYAWLIPAYGAIGAAYATLGGMMVHAAVTWFVAQRVHHVEYEYKRLSEMLVAALVLTFAAHCVNDSFFGAGAKVLLWFSWPVALWAGGLVSRAEKDAVLHLRTLVKAWLGIGDADEPRDEAIEPLK